MLLLGKFDSDKIELSGNQGLWEGGPAGTLFRGPTATDGPETEGTFECLLQTRNNIAKLIPLIKLVWPKGFGKVVWCILMWISGSAFSWYDAFIIISST